MKTYTLTLILLITTTLAFAQLPALKKVKTQVQETELLKNWKVGQSKTMNGQYITKLSGEDDGGRTNITFIPADKDNTTASLEGYSEVTGKTGTIGLFIDRESSKQANADWFTITITDPATGKELQFTKLDTQSPEFFRSGVWYNYIEVNVVDAPPVFNVEVFDNYTRANYNYQVMLDEEAEEETADIENAVCITCNH